MALTSTAAQEMAKAIVMLPPPATVPDLLGPPDTVQLAAPPPSWTVWLVLALTSTVRALLIPIPCAVPPSTETVYPSGSRLCPAVLVETVSCPVVGAGGGGGDAGGGGPAGSDSPPLHPARASASAMACQTFRFPLVP